MVKIKPFKGYRYSGNQINSFEDVITPPYDVISPSALQDYYDRSKYNFSHLILPRSENGITKYDAAAHLLTNWINDGIIAQDKEPSIYIYSHTYPLNGDNQFTIERLGFIALVDVSNGDILPHEHTLQKPFADRLELTKSTRANFGLIFSLYDDRPRLIDQVLEKEVKNRMEDLKFSDENQIIHRLWRLTDSQIIDRIVEEMKQYSCIIADGHHRYKVAQKFYEDFGKSSSNPERFRYTMMCFINSFHEGLIIRPVNRLVYNLGEVQDLWRKLDVYFDISDILDIKAALHEVRNTQIMIDKSINLKNHKLVIFDNKSKQARVLRLRDPQGLHIQTSFSDVYTKTDVNILHSLILEKILGISPEDQFHGNKVEFVKGDEECLLKLEENDKQYCYGFFINPPLLREVFLTSRGGEIMPQKSTYFYPKLYSGLVLHKCEDEIPER